jgi:uncharacterized Zn-finger protein
MQNKNENNENIESECITESNYIYTKNRLLIAKIVYQCMSCDHICQSISDVFKHYHSRHSTSDSVKNCKFINEKSMKNFSETNGKIKNKYKLKCVKKKMKLSKTFKSNINDNKLNENSDQINFKCDFCDNSYANIYSLKRHNNIHINPEICEFVNCGKKFATERELISHLECHNVENKSSFKCTNCTKTFKREVNLKIHMNIHTNPIICELCNKKLATKARLKEHLLSHSSETPLACDWPGCDFAAKVSSNLKSHKRTHTGERPYHCCWPGCGQSFGAQSTLNGHIESRHQMPVVKRFKCEWPACESSFSKKSGLKDHRRTHTGEKPYHCVWPDCGQCFSTMSVLHNHKLTHTGERKFHCDFAECSAKFATSSTLNTHKKLVHKCDYIIRSRWDNKKK